MAVDYERLEELRKKFKKRKPRKYYDIKNILETNCTYNIVYGGRNLGKSYSTKGMIVWEAYTGCDYLTYLKTKELVPKDRYEIGYFRRYDTDIKTASVEAYFADTPISEITGGEYTAICYYQKALYFANVDDNGKYVRGRKAGNCFAVSQAYHYKSLMYPYIGNMVYEEFITEGDYLPREVHNLFSLVSTIARGDAVRVFMIGNSVSRQCPYFQEWGLKNIYKQEPGTIDIYSVKTESLDENDEPISIKIAVERCAEDLKNGKMIFGNEEKSAVAGEWESEVHPHLQGVLNEYKINYTIFFEREGFCFNIYLLTNDKREPFIYVCNTKEKNRHTKRVITDKFSTDKLTTTQFLPITKYDRLVLKLINQGKVCYNTNLCGTEFENLITKNGLFMKV